MEVKRGIPASPGISISQAFVLDSEEARIRQKFAAESEVNSEIEKFRSALLAAQQEVQNERDKVLSAVAPEYLAIFDAHVAMLKDDVLRNEVERLISERSFTAAYALSRVFRTYRRMFLNSEYLRRSLPDIEDMQKRILRHILGERRETLRDLGESVVVVARELTPSQTVSFDRSHVVGFATDAGGQTSHAAILARALEIPAVVGLGNITSDISGGDLLVLDGNRGLVIIDPDEKTLESYRQKQLVTRTFLDSLLRLRDQPAETRDGATATLLANIEFPEEVETCLSHGAGGIGLYRTEFLYVDGDTVPSEQDHFKAYKHAASKFGDAPVVIRTLDLAGDKFFRGDRTVAERNPFLGCRSIRLAFLNIDVFKTQLRAMLRASAFGNVKILFPMISCVDELRRAKLVLGEVMRDLESGNVPFNKDIEVGIMIEVPSAALTADILAREADFFSIGTNDLIQYTLAVDRVNESVASLYMPTHQSILRMIERVIQAGADAGIDVAMCGEMAGDVSFTLLLLGMGLRTFSLSPYLIPEIKKIIRAVSVEEAVAIKDQAMNLDDPELILEFLRERTRDILPEAF